MKKPNFTGRWKYNPGESRLQTPSPASTVIVIDHREPVFILSRIHFVDNDPRELTLELTTDNKETIVDDPDLKLRSRLCWHGQTLVFHSSVTREGNEGINIVRYRLANDDTLIAEETFRSQSLNYDNTWVMERER